MPQEMMDTLAFGAEAPLENSLSDVARGMVGSEILRIASDIRAMKAAGATVCNLTVGDFDSSQFPIPAVYRDYLQEAIAAGETNYPPSDGMLSLRETLCDYAAREWGARYPVESVCVSSGARPILYASYRCLVNPGEKVVYHAPSWNNNHYSWLSGADGVAVQTRPEDGFMPSVDDLKPHLGDARMLCFNSPLNPTGTVISEQALRAITEAVVEENQRRTAQGRRHLFLMHDQIYAALVFGQSRHFMPAALIPEAAPWTIALDGISKCFAATGLRVGWVYAPPAITRRIKDMIGHVGAWAPRPEQVALARFLADEAAVRAYQDDMNRRVQERLEALYDGFQLLKNDGYAVECIEPQGAIYLSLQLKLIGKSIDGQRIENNEQVRKLLLDRAGMAVVPFQAFGFEGDSGWFRMSVGAVSMQDIADSFPRVRKLLDEIS